jgi:hypothetical protein
MARRFQISGRLVLFIAASVVLAAAAAWWGRKEVNMTDVFDANRVAEMLRIEEGQPTTPQATTMAQNQSRWQTVPYPDFDGGSTRMAFDTNSIIVTNDEKGNINGADIKARVVDGDVTIKGKYIVLSFDCGTSREFGFHYRINHSYPLPLPSNPSQQGYIANIACAAVGCERLKREGGSCGSR